IVQAITHANYDHALTLVNQGLDCCCNQGEFTALMEMKSIVVRLRLKCESPDAQFGPTYKTNALPHSFSIEMLDVVQKVLRCRSHYEVLRISHHATYSEVKRAYKRLALRLHPDKNRAPGAEEAFRRINEAADTLTDNQKRIEYNMLTAVGDCFGSKSGRYQCGGDYDHGQMHKAEDVDDDEEEEDGQTEPDAETEKRNEMEFNREHRRLSYQPANQRVPQRQAFYQTEQLVIGLVASMVFIIITLHYLATAPNFSFTPTSTHSVRLVSHNRRVPYFVTPEMAASRTPKQLQRIDQEIEEIYMTDLKFNCKQERKLRE
ncbi:hypothetical protein KR222_009519, partial [Zaprionus bogoriensis]